MDLERPILTIILLLGAGLVFFFFNLKKKTSIGFASLKSLPQGRLAKLSAMLHNSILPISLVLGLILLISGFHLGSKEITRYGYSSDIVVVLDESGSMNDSFRKEGYSPPTFPPFEELPPPADPKNIIGKIDAAKKIIRPFIQNRQDRLSLVIFGDVVIPLYPLSFNREGFLRSFDAQKASLGGTLIDIGLAQALIILRDSPAKSKIIILISDGAGRIDEEKFQIARQIKELGVKLYWVAVDPDQYSEWLMGKFIQENLNPNFIKTIPVTDQKGLAAAFEEIDRMERSLISYKEKREDNIFTPLCLIVLALAALFYGLNAIFND